MSYHESLKVGDVCIVRLVTHCQECTALNGLECTIVEDEHICVRRDCSRELAVGLFFKCAVSNGRFGGFRRDELVKKRPPADESQWIRQQTVPREQFERWLKRVRQGVRAPA